jgi:hypothetical protein
MVTFVGENISDIGMQYHLLLLSLATLCGVTQIGSFYGFAQDGLGKCKVLP